MGCGILVPQPGIKPTSPALEAQSLNLWTTREVPQWITSNTECGGSHAMQCLKLGHNKDSFHWSFPLSLILGEAGGPVVRTPKQHWEISNLPTM